TTASPPESTAAGPADTVYTKNSGERAKTSYGPSASVMTEPLAPSTTATVRRPCGTGPGGGQPSGGAARGGRGLAARSDTSAPAAPAPSKRDPATPAHDTRGPRRP